MSRRRNGIANWPWYALAAFAAITTGPRLILWAIDRHADALWIAANMGDDYPWGDQ